MVCHHLVCSFISDRVHRALLSFPTRRSSDLSTWAKPAGSRRAWRSAVPVCSSRGWVTMYALNAVSFACASGDRDRKSTRLNSSHLGISYAVFCLKKKRDQLNLTDMTTNDQQL